MDKEYVAHLHNEILSSREKNNEILKFAGKWIELEETNLNEVCLSQKETMVCTHSYMDFRHIAKDQQPIIHIAKESRIQGGT